jgi:hypothetical protein
MSLPTWQEAAEEEFWDRVPTDLHEGAVRDYLGTNGDAIDARVSKLKSMADDLLAKQFAGPSIAVSMTAWEVMIRYFCVRPILEGVFLSDLIAHEIAQKIIEPRRNSNQKSLLVPLLKPWGIDVSTITLPTSGRQLWETMCTPITEARNNFVHRGDDVSVADAALAIECVGTFRNEVVLKIAQRLGFTLDKSGCWRTVFHDGMVGGGETRYVQRDPFR